MARLGRRIRSRAVKEERDAGVANHYFGNGKVVWIQDAKGNKGEITLADREEKAEDARAAVSTKEDSDLPF